MTRKKPTEADKAKLWPRCEVCGQQSPFVFGLNGRRTCIPCYTAPGRYLELPEHGPNCQASGRLPGDAVSVTTGRPGPLEGK